jgi:hypothetical protein
MSIEHLKLLRNSLEKNNWVILEELPGNEYDISAIWIIARPNGTSEFKLIFEGLDDLECLPIEKAYGCYVETNGKMGLYFSKVNKFFPSDLSNFIKTIPEKSL